MQPFDALTMRAALQEAKPLLLNRRVDKVYQLARDEIVLALRLKTGPGHFLLSAQASFGRLCFINTPNLPKHGNPPAFCQLLRKHLTSAMIVDIQQLPGERVADFILSCTDELGTKSLKVLTAEVMGRHSNLIFWERESGKIIGASHVVTAEWSRPARSGAWTEVCASAETRQAESFRFDTRAVQYILGKARVEPGPSQRWSTGWLQSLLELGDTLRTNLLPHRTYLMDYLQ